MQVRESLEREVEAWLDRQLPDVDLREVTLIGPDHSGTLRVVVDHPDGVDHALCGRVTDVLRGPAGVMLPALVAAAFPD